jgi:ubiquinol-cytochrome c reductase core subunit 2
LDSELRGNSLYSSVGREHVLFGSEFLRDDAVDVVPTLVKNTFNKEFQVYEFLDILKGTNEQSLSALNDPTTLVYEKLHQTAFRKGLGNPLFASEEALDDLNRAKVLDFVGNIGADGVVVVGSGIAHSDLKQLVQEAFESVPIPSKTTPKVVSKYFGGETRIEAGPSSSAVYAVAFPGASLNSEDYYPALVLQELFHGESKVKYGTPSKGTESTNVSGFSASYSDAGLVGFVVEGANVEIKDIVKKTIASVSQATAEQVEAAKKAAIIRLESQSSASIVAKLGAQAISNKPLASVELLQKVSVQDVQKVIDLVNVSLLNNLWPVKKLLLRMVTCYNSLFPMNFREIYAFSILAHYMFTVCK